MKWAATAATYPNKSKVLKPSGLFFVSLKYDVPSLGPAARNTTIPIARAKIPGKSRRMVESFIGTAFYVIKKIKKYKGKNIVSHINFPSNYSLHKTKHPRNEGALRNILKNCSFPRWSHRRTATTHSAATAVRDELVHCRKTDKYVYQPLNGRPGPEKHVHYVPIASHKPAQADQTPVK